MPEVANKKTLILFVGIALVGSAIVTLVSFSKKEPTSLDNDPLAGLSFETEDIGQIAAYDYTEKFAQSGYDFSFRYPSGFEIMTIPEDYGDIVVVQNVATQIGVQIFAGPLDEPPEKITRRFIKDALPESIIRNTKEVSFGEGDSRIEGLLFDSDNPNFQNGSSELWFVRKGMIYQLTTYRALRPLLEGVFATWQFVR